MVSVREWTVVNPLKDLTKKFFERLGRRGTIKGFSESKSLGVVKINELIGTGRSIKIEKYL